MRLPIDFKSRLEDLNRRRLLSVGGRARVAKLWALILSSGLLMTVSAIGVAGYRFLYWSDVANYTPQDVGNVEVYDEEKLEMVLSEYKDREARVAGILNREWEVVTSTTSATTTVTDEGAVD